MLSRDADRDALVDRFRAKPSLGLTTDTMLDLPFLVQPHSIIEAKLAQAVPRTGEYDDGQRHKGPLDRVKTKFVMTYINFNICSTTKISLRI